MKPSRDELQTVLNPQLYRALHAATGGHVRVTGRGQTCSLLYEVDWSSARPRKRARVVRGKHEEYYIDCPFCGDRRKRLAINHLWGTLDEETGQRLLHLAHCLHENCLADNDVRHNFYRGLFPLGGEATTMDIIRRAASGPSTGHRRNSEIDRLLPPPIKRNCEVNLPDPLFAIANSMLPKSATDYLIDRGFDPMELWIRWQVCYCPSGPWSYRKVDHPRIFVPLHRNPHRSDTRPCLAGWTARKIGDGLISRAKKGPPKYWHMTGVEKGNLLYGWPMMQKCGPIVVVEGVTDVWRLGCNALAILGKSASTFQLGMLLRAAKGRAIVVFLDRDAQDEAIKLRDNLRWHRQSEGEVKPVVLAKLPAGKKDVGELTRDEAWECVAAALQKPVEALGVDYREFMVAQHAAMPSVWKPRLKRPRG